ncbi:MAG TPA: hypothetical protein VF421_10885 [Niabella sp.]
MKKTVYVLTISAFVFFLISCSAVPRYINSPEVQNAAFFREKGGLKLGAAFAANPDKLFADQEAENSTIRGRDKSLGVDVQAAYALTDHFFIQAAGMHRWEKDLFNKDALSDNEGSVVTYTRSMYDLGAGFYTAVNANGKIYFNGVLGAGFGTSKSEDLGYPEERKRRYDFDFVKYYIAPSFQFFFTEYARLAVTPRFSLLTASHIQTNYSSEELNLLNYYTLPGKAKVFFEPGLLFQAGLPNVPWLKLDVGAQVATNPLTGKHYDTQPPVAEESWKLRSRRFLLSLGLSFYPFEKK